MLNNFSHHIVVYTLAFIKCMTYVIVKYFYTQWLIFQNILSNNICQYLPYNPYPLSVFICILATTFSSGFNEGLLVINSQRLSENIFILSSLLNESFSE